MSKKNWKYLDTMKLDIAEKHYSIGGNYKLFYQFHLLRWAKVGSNGKLIQHNTSEDFEIKYTTYLPIVHYDGYVESRLVDCFHEMYDWNESGKCWLADLKFDNQFINELIKVYPIRLFKNCITRSNYIATKKEIDTSKKFLSESDEVNLYTFMRDLKLDNIYHFPQAYLENKYKKEN